MEDEFNEEELFQSVVSKIWNPISLKVRNVDCPSALYVYIDRLRAASRGANASIDPDADVRTRRRFAQLRAFRVTETASAAGSEK